MNPSHTSRALESMTDSGLFERLATAVLRSYNPLYERLVHTGVNASGRTITSPLDGICFEPGADPPHMVATHHTTIALNDLDAKWLSTSIPGDVAKTADFAREQRKEQPQLRATLVLTTNNEPNADLVARVYASAAANCLELDLWTRSRLAHFLDNKPDGQWLRREFLGLEQELLSSELLHELSRTSLRINSPPSEPRTWIPRSLDTDLTDRQHRDVTFVVSASGTGKSIACYRRLSAHVRAGGFGLVLNSEVILQAATLEVAIRATIENLHPNLVRMSDTPLSFCSPDRRLLLVVDDGHRLTRDPSLVEKVARWSSVWNDVEGSARPPIWQLLFPIWPEVLASLRDEVRQKLAPMTLITRGFSAIEGRQAVFARARVEKLTLSKSDAQAISAGLGQDPLLIALHDLTRSPDPSITITSFVDNALGRVSAARRDLPAFEYREALLALASAMLTTGNLQPTWRAVKSWSSIRTETLRLIGTLLDDGVLMTLTGAPKVQQIVFRHDRVRDWLLTYAMEDLLSRDSLDASISHDPYYADIVGSVLVRMPLNRTLVARVAVYNPLALFRALQLLGSRFTQRRASIRHAIDRWVAGSDGRDRSRYHVRQAALRILSETDAADVSEIVSKFPENGTFAQLARLRNGDSTAGIELCCRLHPGTIAPWRDSIIDHAKVYHESALVTGLVDALMDRHMNRIARIGALRLAGHLGSLDLCEAINTSWEFDQERVAQIGDYLWAFSRCCESDPEGYLGPVCDAWATLPERPTSEGETDARSAVSEHHLKWAFGRYPPRNALDCLIRRGATNDLRWPITLLLREVDDPRAIVFIVHELASTSRYFHDAGLSPPPVNHVRDHWRRLQEDGGRGMSIESRQRLLDLWQCRTNDRHVRRQAFGLWEATRLPDDIAVLRDFPPEEELADSVLHARISRQDSSAVNGVLERQDADNHGRWLWSARHLWSPEMTDALDALLSRRAVSSVRRWGASIEADRNSCDLLIRLPEAQAERLMTKHWEHLRYAPRFVQAALYVSTPFLLKEVQRAVVECSIESEVNLLEGLGITWGLGFHDHPGLVRKEQLIALKPYYERLPGMDIASLWHACNDRGWYDLRRDLVDMHLQPPYPIGKWDSAKAMSRLDKMIDDRSFLFLDSWLRDLLRSGVLWSDVLESLIGWLECKGSLRALELVAAAVRTFGLRSDLAAIESFKCMAPPRSGEIIEDTEFAVQRRSIQ